MNTLRLDGAAWKTFGLNESSLHFPVTRNSFKGNSLIFRPYMFVFWVFTMYRMPYPAPEFVGRLQLQIIRLCHVQASNFLSKIFLIWKLGQRVQTKSSNGGNGKWHWGGIHWAGPSKRDIVDRMNESKMEFEHRKETENKDWETAEEMRKRQQRKLGKKRRHSDEKEEVITPERKRKEIVMLLIF